MLNITSLSSSAYPEFSLLDAYIEIVMQAPPTEVLGPIGVLIIQYQQRVVFVLVEGWRTLSGALNSSSCDVIKMNTYNWFYIRCTLSMLRA